MTRHRQHVDRLAADLQQRLDRIELGLHSLDLTGAGGGPFARASAETRQLFEHPRPWMVEESVEFASAHLRPDMTALEWGGGASTPFWCERVGILHTVEASPGWALILVDYMSRRLDLVDRWRFHFVGANWASSAAAKRRTGRSMPPPDVRESLERDYAILLPERIDAIFLDGAVRQRTSLRLTDYVERDAPAVIVVDNMEAGYVSSSLDPVDLSAYERHDFWGDQPSGTNGGTKPHGTSVWIRREI